VTSCVWTLRDGSRCRSLAVVDELCAPHFNLRRALDAEKAERADRGEPPMNSRDCERFLNMLRRARKAEKREQCGK
jgi:hypothetical protein